MHKRLFSGCTATAVGTLAIAIAGVAQAAPVVDGTRDAEYGAPIVVQSNPTGFGDSNTGSVTVSNGSEIDAAYGRVADGNLYLFFAGNVETNFNKLDIFIDSVSGGMNQLTPIPNDHGVNRMAADPTGGPGLKFDTGFTADRWVSFTAGNTPNTQVFIDYADLIAGNGYFVGSTQAPDGSTPPPPTISGGDAGAPAIQASFNGSNITGVTGSTAPNDAASVNTGVELAIPLSALGDPTGSIAITAFVNGSSHDFASNQWAGPLAAGTANLGEPRNIDLTQQAGNQYFVVAVPEPASAGLIALGLLALGGTRRRGRPQRAA